MPNPRKLIATTIVKSGNVEFGRVYEYRNGVDIEWVFSNEHGARKIAHSPLGLENEIKLMFPNTTLQFNRREPPH